MNRAERRATFDALLRDVCERPAHSSPELRREASGRTTLAGAVGRLVDHIRQRATLVTDADVEAARAEGLDDDQLYELTVATSLGESGRRLDAVARALKGDAKQMRLPKVDHGHAWYVRAFFGLVRLTSRREPPDILKTLYYRPGFFGLRYSALTQEVMRGESAWTVSERELFAAYTSALNQCVF